MCKKPCELTVKKLPEIMTDPHCYTVWKIGFAVMHLNGILLVLKRWRQGPDRSPKINSFHRCCSDIAFNSRCRRGFWKRRKYMKALLRMSSNALKKMCRFQFPLMSKCFFVILYLRLCSREWYVNVFFRVLMLEVPDHILDPASRVSLHVRFAMDWH